MRRICRILKSEGGVADYLSAVVYVLIVVMVLSLAVNVFSVLAVKRQMDLTADQMAKQIQLAGGTNHETEELFQTLCAEMTAAENISYQVQASYYSPKPSGMTHAIQIGNSFTVTIYGEAQLGGMWRLTAIQIPITAKAAGVSERYWK